MALTKAGGTWVVGDRFFDRSADLVALTERCQEGTHTLLTGQRRIGKTSLVRELLRILVESGQFDTVFADLEGGSTPADAIAEIWNQAREASGFWHRVHHRLRQLGTRIEALEAADIRVRLRADVNAGNWRARGEGILAALVRGNKPVVLALDELPIIVNQILRCSGGQITPEGTQAAGEFLGWLRKMAQQHQGRVTFILTGSVGLEPILRQAGLSAHANIFLPYELKAWDEETASACIAELARTYHVVVPADVRRSMCLRLRCCIPHHVLEHDGYLTPSGDHYRFTSGLIEDWWRARHGQFFKTIAEMGS